MTERRIFYTDGGASPNPGPGGWGVVEVSEGGEILQELSGGEDETTNNRMELSAAQAALAATTEGCSIEIVTDSTYVRKGMTEWISGWMARGWKRREGNRLVPIKNEDLWRSLEALERNRKVTWRWVKGHAGDKFNERADELATEAIQARRAETPPQVLPTLGDGDHEITLKITCVRGRGAWAATVQGGERRPGQTGSPSTLQTGTQSNTTANKLDLEAASLLLEPIEDGRQVIFRTGSDYLRNGASQWLANWKKAHWTTKAGAPVKNQDLWQRLDTHLTRLRVEFVSLEKESPEAKELAKASKNALAN